MVFIEVETDEGITGLGESLLSHGNDIVEALHARHVFPREDIQEKIGSKGSRLA